MINDWEKSTRRLSPSVNVPLSRMPSSSFHSESRSLLDLVKENQRELDVFGAEPIEILLSQQRRSFPVAQVSRRRANQLSNLV